MLVWVLLRWVLRGVRHAYARSAHVVTVAIAGCNKGLIAMGAFEIFLLSVRFLMFDHITELWRWYLAINAAKKLVGPPRLIIHHVVLDKAKLASVVAVAVTDAFLYCFVKEDIGDVEVASVWSRNFQAVFYSIFLLWWRLCVVYLRRIDHKVWLRRSHRGHLRFHISKRCGLNDRLWHHLVLRSLNHGLWAGLRRAVERYLVWWL